MIAENCLIPYGFNKVLPTGFLGKDVVAPESFSHERWGRNPRHGLKLQYFLESLDPNKSDHLGCYEQYCKICDPIENRFGIKKKKNRKNA